ncbi:chaperone protein dnaJ 20, chloroplastic-like [Miscanthus floridulus]|uniref:chaperone protein dnaJ 20, chloroplastic-like n=1 Tax=Miscanthus floridulus TaxID=154761 RepID=UPI0034587635
MPHLAATPPTSSAAAAAAAVPTAQATAAGRVAFRRPWNTPRLRVLARGVRREGGGGVRTEEQEQTASRTFYDLLGISADGSPDEVRAAYRRLALKYHPDVSPPGAAAENTRRFIEVQEAYETLSDPSRRDSYDRALARGVCRLAFSGRRSQSHRAYYHHHHQEQEGKSGWRRSWEDQIAELKRRSTTKDSEENLSWGARMRRRAEASSAEQL